MPQQLKLSSLFNPRDERLPAKTGIGGKLKPMNPRSLFRPDEVATNKPALRNLLAPYKPIQPKEIRMIEAKRLQLAVDKINEHIADSTIFKGVRFDIHERSQKNFAVIRDTRTGEVLRTFPPENVLELAGNLRAATGMLINRKT